MIERNLSLDQGFAGSVPKCDPGGSGHFFLAASCISRFPEVPRKPRFEPRQFFPVEMR